MTEPNKERRTGNAGAFLGPDLLAPMPMRTLSDDYRDIPAEPPEEREPDPEAPGPLRRAADRLRHLHLPGR